MSDTIQKVRPVKKIADVRIEATLNVSGFGGDLEKHAKEAEWRVKDFNDFIRDHRSQDDVHLNVVQDIEEVCCLCGVEIDDSTAKE